jgi:hypothetical protein
MDSAVLGLGTSGCDCCTVRAFHHGLCCARVRDIGLRLLYSVRFRVQFALDDGIGSHACALEALACV